MPSGKYNVFGALIRCQAGPLKYTFIVQFGLAMLLTLRWPLSYQLLRIKLPPMHFRTGERHARTFYTD